jgi:hypothetical protein
MVDGSLIRKLRNLLTGVKCVQLRSIRINTPRIITIITSPWQHLSIKSYIRTWEFIELSQGLITGNLYRSHTKQCLLFLGDSCSKNFSFKLSYNSWSLSKILIRLLSCAPATWFISAVRPSAIFSSLTHCCRVPAPSEVHFHRS